MSLDIIKKINHNPNILYLNIDNNNKVIYQNINNKVIIKKNALILNKYSNVKLNKDNNIYINNIIKYCKKLDKNIKHCETINNIVLYLHNLTTMFVNDKTYTTINKKFIYDCVNMFHNKRNISVSIYCKKSFKVDYTELTMKQVMINIISNAIKYNYDNGNIIIKVFGTNSNKVCISVYNTGYGLSNKNTIDGNKLGLKHCLSLLNNPKVTIESLKNKYFILNLYIDIAL